MSISKMASRRLSSEKSSVLTKEALQDLNLHEFDVLEGWEPSSGKVYTKVRAISARINQNFDGWPSEELKKSYRTFLGKPVFVNHVNDDPRKARGVVVAARFVESDDDKYIEVIQEVDADKFPMLAHELVTGGLDSVSMGAEARICKCSYCGNEAGDMMSMCAHVLGQKGQILSKVNNDGTQEDILVYEECRDISFFELSYVFDPADETAVVSNVLTANKKRGYGETSLPPQVDTLRDEEEDLGGYFIEPPMEFQEPDLDKEYPAIGRGEPLDNRRDEEQREDFNMSRVSRNRRRQTRTRQAAPHPSGIDFDAILGEGWENEHRYPQERQPSFDNWDHENYEGPGGTGRIQWEGDNDLSWETSQGESGRTKGNIWDAMQDVEDSLGHYSSNRGSKGNRMSDRARMSRRRRYYADNDQGEQEEVFISQTPPAEPVETGEGAADAPNNTKSDRVKTDQNRSTHTNLEARRRARRRHAAPELYRDFLEYAQGQGMDLDRMQEMYDRNYESNGMDDEADRAVYELESLMSDFAGGDDDIFYDLLDAPGSYELNHPNNFRSSRRRARRRSSAKNLHMIDDMQLLDGYATVSMGLEEGWGEDEGMTQEDLQDYEEELERRGIDPYNNDVYSSRRRRSRRRMAEQSDDFNLNSRADIARNVEDEDLFDTPVETQPKDASRRRALRRRPNRQARRRASRSPLRLIQSMTVNLRGPHKTAEYNGWSNYETWNAALWYGNDPGAYELAKSARSPEELAENAPYVVGDEIDFDQVDWNEVYEAFEEDRTASLRRVRVANIRGPRKTADYNGWSNWETWNTALWYGNDPGAYELAKGARSPEELAENAPYVVGDDVDFDQVNWDEVYDAFEEDRTASRKRRRRMADTNLDLAAPDGRVNVEAPVKDTTDEEAQASQFDKGDYGHNAGDHLADPDLSTDQNWAPGEGNKTSRRASQIEGMRLAEAMVEAGLEKHDDRWKLAEAYTKLPSAIVRDRIALLSRTASVKSPSRDDNGQRPIKSARKAPGLGQRPSLQKSAENKSDDYSLYF